MFLEVSQASCRFLWKPFSPVDFGRTPEPVPRTQVLSYFREGIDASESPCTSMQGFIPDIHGNIGVTF